MSSVNNNDEVKKLREYYQKREEELKARQAKEIKKLSDVQKTSLEKVSNDSSEAGNATRESNKSAITKSDMRHSNDIEKIKAAHTKQLREQAERQAGDDGLLKKAYKDNAERAEKAHQRETAAKEHSYSEAQKDQQQKLEQTVGKYNQDHNEKVVDLKHDLMSKQARVDKENQKRELDQREELLTRMNDLKLNKDREIKRLENQSLTEKEKLVAANQRVVSLKDEESQGVLEDMRELHIDGVERERRQYTKALQEERKTLEVARDEMKRGPGEKKIAELNDKIAHLERQNIRNKQKMERAKKRELENTKLSYEDSLNLLRTQKSGMVQEHNKTNSDLQKEVEKKANEKVAASQEFFQTRLEDEADHHDQNLTRMQRKLNRDNVQKHALQDVRFKRMKEEAAREQEQLQKTQTRGLAMLKEEHQDTVMQDRRDHGQQARIMKQSYEEQLGKLQMKQAQEIDRMKTQYDTMVSQLRSEFEGQAVEMNQKLRQASTEKENFKEQELKTKEAQFDYRLKKMEEAYSDSLKRLSGQHEQGAQMLSANNKEGKGRYA